MFMEVTDNKKGTFTLNKKIRFITTAAIIAALYAALTVALSFISYGPVQFRVAEILTVLPFFTPAAIPGLFIGCIISNLFSPVVLIDVIVGSAATLLAAFLTSKMPNKWLAPLPPVICNGVIVGIELGVVYKMPLLPTILSVGLGEAVVCFVGGYLFMFALDKVKSKLKLF